MDQPTESSVILGIDPGTNIMGYGVIRQEKKNIRLVTLGVLKLGKIDDAHEKLRKIFSRVLQLIETHQPDFLAIEAPFYGKNVQSMLKLGRAQGVAIAAAVYREIPVFEYSPRKIKQSITGKGAASKEQVAEMLYRLLDLKERPEYLDATDALAVAVCHSFQRGAPGAGEKYSGWEAFMKKNPGRITGKS